MALYMTEICILNSKESGQLKVFQLPGLSIHLISVGIRAKSYFH